MRHAVESWGGMLGCRYSHDAFLRALRSQVLQRPSSLSESRGKRTGAAAQALQRKGPGKCPGEERDYGQGTDPGVHGSSCLARHLQGRGISTHISGDGRKEEDKDMHTLCCLLDSCSWYSPGSQEDKLFGVLTHWKKPFIKPYQLLAEQEPQRR